VFNPGDAIRSILVRIPTYQGPDCGYVDFAAPLVELLIENHCGLTIQMGRPADHTGHMSIPEMVIERRRNGWCIALAPDHCSDSNLLIYVVDNGDEPKTYIVMDGQRSQWPEILENPPDEVDQIPQVQGGDS
jgi:hypothetical protein